MKRWLLSSCLLCVFLMTGCGKRMETPVRSAIPIPPDADISTQPPGHYGGRLIDVSPGEPTTFNPLVSEDATSAGMIGLLSSGITSYDPLTEKVIPGLAKSWEISKDSKTFTFHLRRGLKWSDGEPLTADDVVFTFQCYYDKRFPTRKAYDMSVDGKPFTVEKVDDLTFRVTTPDIYAPFLLFMGDVEVLPKHKLEAAYRDGTLMKKWTIATAQETPKEIASSGPFVIRYYRPGERIVFEPNPYYYRFDSKGQRLPYVDYYVTKFVKDANASVVAFATGLTDSEGVGPDNVGWVQRGVKTYHFTMYDRGPSTASSFICFNENPGHDKNGKPFVTPYKLKWFTNQKFRQAISYGIDRQGLVQGVLFGRGAPLWGPESPTNHKWFNPHVKQYPYDPKKALELLESQGFRRDKNGDLRDADGNKVEFGLMTNAENPIRQNMATVFKENMAALGINVRLQFLDFGTFVGKLQDSYDYEACMIGFTGGGDPVGGMSIYVSKGRLHQWYPNQKTPATPWEARMDELMMKQLKTLDEKKRQEYYFEVQQIMSEELPLIYLVTPNAYQGVKDKWQNVQIAPTGPVFRVDEVWGKQ